jgi:hypothetical protein
MAATWVSPPSYSSGAVAAVGDTSTARTVGVVVVATTITAVATASSTPTLDLPAWQGCHVHRRAFSATA